MPLWITYCFLPKKRMEYHFVDADVYCPWDVINYVDLLKAAPKSETAGIPDKSGGEHFVHPFVVLI